MKMVLTIFYRDETKHYVGICSNIVFLITLRHLHLGKNQQCYQINFLKLEVCIRIMTRQFSQ